MSYQGCFKVKSTSQFYAKYRGVNTNDIHVKYKLKFDTTFINDNSAIVSESLKYQYNNSKTESS